MVIHTVVSVCMYAMALPVSNLFDWKYATAYILFKYITEKILWSREADMDSSKCLFFLCMCKLQDRYG